MVAPADPNDRCRRPWALPRELEENRLEVGLGRQRGGIDPGLGKRPIDLGRPVAFDGHREPAVIRGRALDRPKAAALEPRQRGTDLVLFHPHAHAAPAREQLLDRSLADEPPLGNDANDVGELADFAKDVARNEDRLASRGEVAQRVPHRDDACRVQAVGGLVEQQELWVAQESGCDSQSLLHAERVRGNAVAGAFGQADYLQQLVNATPERGRAGRRQPAQVLAAGQERIERGRLDERPHLEQAPPIALAEGASEQLDRPRIRVDQAGQQTHRRGLAGTVRAQEAVDDAVRHGQVQTREGHPRSISLVECPGSDRQPARAGRRCSCSQAPSSGAVVRARRIVMLRGNGGDEGTRTPDPRDANAVLSQLSYIPKGRPEV